MFDMTEDDVHNILNDFKSGELQNADLWTNWCFRKKWFW